MVSLKTRSTVSTSLADLLVLSGHVPAGSLLEKEVRDLTEFLAIQAAVTLMTKDYQIPESDIPKSVRERKSLVTAERGEQLLESYPERFNSEAILRYAATAVMNPGSDLRQVWDRHQSRIPQDEFKVWTLFARKSEVQQVESYI